MDLPRYYFRVMAMAWTVRSSQRWPVLSAVRSVISVLVAALLVGGPVQAQNAPPNRSPEPDRDGTTAHEKIMPSSAVKPSITIVQKELNDEGDLLNAVALTWWTPLRGGRWPVSWAMMNATLDQSHSAVTVSGSRRAATVS